MYTDASIAAVDANSISSLEHELHTGGVGTSGLRQAAGLEVFYGLEGDPSAFDKLPVLGAVRTA